VRALVSKAGAVLIFDECTSGFRQVIGGTHLVHDVEPDLMVLGKTLGNGYAVNAILGRGDVMCAATETFISSTFWTERIGSAAALATLRVMTETDAPARVHAIGLDVRRRWHELATAVGLTLETAGLPAIGTFSVAGLSPLAVKTFVTQEMLKAGYLASTAMYASIAHTPEVLDQYFETLSPVFERLAAVDDDDDLLQLLPNGLADAGFKRTT
jgi:glutamate-1-semialdehyde 2,1-aminomutase